jgi:hypothetical protein
MQEIHAIFQFVIFPLLPANRYISATTKRMGVSDLLTPRPIIAMSRICFALKENRLDVTLPVIYPIPYPVGLFFNRLRGYLESDHARSREPGHREHGNFPLGLFGGGGTTDQSRTGRGHWRAYTPEKSRRPDSQIQRFKSISPLKTKDFVDSPKHS